MELIEKKLSELIPYANNPRKNDGAVDAVMESIKQCGYISPIVIDENNEVLAGHTRLKALKRMKAKTVKCVVMEGLTEEQKRKYRILDNKTGEFAEWDIDLLNIELEGLDFEGFDFGFDLPEEEEEKEIIEDEVPEVDETVEPTAKLGDIWQLGRHRLMCGDSTDIANVQTLMEGKDIDLVFTDPPYNMGYIGAGIKRIWNNGLRPLDIYRRAHFSSRQEGHEEAGDVHPTMKPLKLITDKLKISSNENSNVLDLFGGSGSTLIACEQLDRNCYMMELDPKYVDVIIKRWEDFTGEKAVLLNG